MTRVLALLAILCPAFLAADDLRPDASGAPLFQVFPLMQNASDHLWLDRDHPLLSVEAVRDFYVKKDKRRVRVVLTADDARRFAYILDKLGAVGLTAGDSTAVIKAGKGFDGSLTFDDPVAAYLRHRFHIKPGSNEVDSLPLSPFAAPNP